MRCDAYRVFCHHEFPNNRFRLAFKYFLEQSQGRACSKWRQHFPNTSHTCWAREFHLERPSRRPWHPIATIELFTNKSGTLGHVTFAKSLFLLRYFLDHVSIDHWIMITRSRVINSCTLHTYSFIGTGNVVTVFFGISDKDRGFVFQRHHYSYTAECS
jgi:hypothetical protein